MVEKHSKEMMNLIQEKRAEYIEDNADNAASAGTNGTNGANGRNGRGDDYRNEYDDDDFLLGEEDVGV